MNRLKRRWKLWIVTSRYYGGHKQTTNFQLWLQFLLTSVMGCGNILPSRHHNAVKPIVAEGGCWDVHSATQRMMGGFRKIKNNQFVQKIVLWIVVYVPGMTKIKKIPECRCPENGMMTNLGQSGRHMWSSSPKCRHVVPCVCDFPGDGNVIKTLTVASSTSGVQGPISVGFSAWANIFGFAAPLKV